MDARGRKAAAGLGTTERAAAGASAGGRRLENVFRGVGLAFGGITGPAGRLGNVLLGFAPGGLYVAAAVLGLGILSKAYEQNAKEAEAMAKRVEAAQARSLPGKPKDMSALEAAGVLEEQLAAVRGRRRRLVGETADRMARGETVATSLTDLLAADLREAQQLQERIDALRGIAKEEKALLSTRTAQQIIETDILDLHRKQALELAKQTPLAGRLAGTGGLDQAARRNIFGEVIGAPTRVGTGASAVERVGNRAAQLEKDIKTSLEETNEAREKEQQGIRQTAQTIYAVSGAVATLIATINGGGGFWATLSSLAGGIGSVLALSNPVAGAALIGGGIVVGALSQSSASPAPAAGSAPSPQQPLIFQATIVGPNDPSAQRDIAAVVRNAALRGLSLTSA